MFSKLAALFVAAFMAVFVVALPSPQISNSCNGGSAYCCNSSQPATSKGSQSKTGVGAIVPAAVSAGITCTPINILALSGESCTSQTICCDNNTYSGLVDAGCNPINANL